MTVVLIALAILAGLLLLLAVPIDLAFRCRGIDAPDAQLRLRWLFGLLRIERHWPRPVRDASAPAAAKKRKNRSRGLALLRQDAFRQRLWRLLKDLLRALHIHDLALQLKLGLGDPADTGRLWAVVGPLSAVLQGRRNVRLDLQPEFVDAALEFDAQGRLTLIPLQYLALALVFALSPPSIQAWRSLRTHHG